MLNLNLNILGAANKPIVPIQPAPTPSTTTTTTAAPLDYYYITKCSDSTPQFTVGYPVGTFSVNSKVTSSINDNYVVVSVGSEQLGSFVVGATGLSGCGPGQFRNDPYSASLLFATPGNRFNDLGMAVDYSDVHATIAGVGSNLAVNTGSIGDPAYTNFLANGYINSTKVQSSASFYNQNNSDFNFGAQPITIEGWINFGNTGASQKGFYSDYTISVPSLSGIWCSVLSDGRLRFITSIGSGEYIIQSGVLGWTDNTWYHIAFVRNGSTYKIYRDGTEVATGTVSGTINSTTRPKYIMNFNNLAETQVFVQDYKIYTAAVYTSSFTPPLSMVTL
jgi:hypothetical protein